MQNLTRITALLGLLILPLAAMAQSQFSPAITVNDKVISNFEIAQRIKLLELFRTPGDLPELAREQLIEDRLKAEELARAGVVLTDDGLARAMEDFATRANMDLAQFTTVLNQNGIDQATLRDFVKVGVSWRDYIRNRYGNRVNVTDAEIDQALGQAGSSAVGIEVLLSEIIIPAPPPEAAQAMATATRISRLTSAAAFEAEARRVSALPSRSNGGRLGWLPITNYPPAIRGIILALANGEVSAPLPITNGVALFQMRGVREVAQPRPEVASIEYAAFYIAGGRSEAALRQAATVAGEVDTCDDLYGVAKGLPPEQLERSTLPPDQIPQDVALELARLDPGEVSYNLTRADGQTLVLLMLCSRLPVLEGDVDRDAVRNQLLGQRLAGYADGLLADLRAAATIIVN